MSASRYTENQNRDAFDNVFYQDNSSVLEDIKCLVEEGYNPYFYQGLLLEMAIKAGEEDVVLYLVKDLGVLRRGHYYYTYREAAHFHLLSVLDHYHQEDIPQKEKDLALCYAVESLERASFFGSAGVSRLETALALLLDAGADLTHHNYYVLTVAMRTLPSPRSLDIYKFLLGRLAAPIPPKVFTNIVAYSLPDLLGRPDEFFGEFYDSLLSEYTSLHYSFLYHVAAVGRWEHIKTILNKNPFWETPERLFKTAKCFAKKSKPLELMVLLCEHFFSYSQKEYLFKMLVRRSLSAHTQSFLRSHPMSSKTKQETLKEVVSYVSVDTLLLLWQPGDSLEGLEKHFLKEKRLYITEYDYVRVFLEKDYRKSISHWIQNRQSDSGKA